MCVAATFDAVGNTISAIHPRRLEWYQVVPWSKVTTEILLGETAIVDDAAILDTAALAARGHDGQCPARRTDVLA